MFCLKGYYQSFIKANNGISDQAENETFKIPLRTHPWYFLGTDISSMIEMIFQNLILPWGNHYKHQSSCGFKNLANAMLDRRGSVKPVLGCGSLFKALATISSSWILPNWEGFAHIVLIGAIILSKWLSLPVLWYLHLQNEDNNNSYLLCLLGRSHKLVHRGYWIEYLA